MMDFKRTVYLILGTLLAGCMTIRKAHEAQAEAEGEVTFERAVIEHATIPELIDFAMTNRPSIVSARLAVEDAQLALKQIDGAAPLISPKPWNSSSLSLSGGHSAGSRGTHLKDHDFDTGNGSASAALSLDILLYDFGRNAAEGKAQAERVIAAEESYLEAEHELLKSVASSAFDCGEKEALVKVAEMTLETARAHLEQLERRLEAGEAIELDVTRAKSDVASAYESLVVASNDFEVAAVKLSAAVGAKRVTLAPSLLAPAKFDEGAVTNAPAYRLAAARARAASHDIDRAIADLYPSISASASLSWTDPLWFFKWGLSGVESLTSGFRKTTAVERSVVALQQALATRDETLLSLERDLKLKLAARKDAAERIEAAEQTLKAADENLKLVEARLELGEVNRVDLSDANKSVASAWGSLIKAHIAAELAEIEIYTLLGLEPEWGVAL